MPADPFVSIDRDGVGELIRIAAERGRKVRKNLKLGICGEHGGDPASVAFCHEIELDYVSCSPFRVPIARLAAAQAALGKGARGRRMIGTAKFHGRAGFVVNRVPTIARATQWRGAFAKNFASIISVRRCGAHAYSRD